MKKVILFIFLFTASFCIAQNYQCLQSDSKHYFTNANGYLRGIRIDSVRTTGDTSIYYPFHTPRGAYSGTSMLDSTGGSWLGKKVIKLVDGTYLFDNFWHDTVVIKTYANSGDSWIFFKDTATSIFYRAEVTATDTMTVLGNLDSVKKIVVTTWDNTTNITYDSLNNMELILSKNYGFVQTIDLYTFPYNQPGIINGYSSGFDFYNDESINNISNYSIGIHVQANSVFKLFNFISPSYEQLYQWDTGDVYEYAVCNGRLGVTPSLPWAPPDEYDIDSITGINLLADTIQYSFTGSRISFDGTWNPSYTIYIHYSSHANTGTLVYNTTLLIDTVLMPEEFGQEAVYYYLPNDSSFCLTNPLYGVTVSGLRGVYYMPVFEVSYPVSTYKSPLGLLSTEYFTADDFVYENSRKLIYFRRNDTLCGGLLIPTSVTNIESPDNSISLFPNPTTTSLTITSPNKINQITIANLLGQTVYTRESTTPEPLLKTGGEVLRIDVADLPKGMYLVRINEIEVRKFVKQ